MSEFWESSFNDKQTMWGFKPADSTLETVELFLKNGLNKILIPGFGYGRNAQVFTDNGFQVTGIEISETAIALAKKNYGDNVKVHHGPVGDMPFDQEVYEGIYCYSLIHLLEKEERSKLISDCYHQLAAGGYMVFVALSKNTKTYGEGEKISEDQFLTKYGVKLFFYDSGSVEKEFGKYGLIESVEINEPAKNTDKGPAQKFWKILCRKPSNDLPQE